MEREDTSGDEPIDGDAGAPDETDASSASGEPAGSAANATDPDADESTETQDGGDDEAGAASAESGGDAPGADASDRATEPAAEAEAAEPSVRVKVVDKRRFARLLGFGKTEGPGAEPGGERVPSYVAELKERTERAEAHARAEVEAARARLERHYETRLAAARAELLTPFLGVLDNLERALAVDGAADSAIFEGVSATRDLFLKTLGELGAEPISAVGEVFDPELHEAVEQVPVDDATLDGRVVGELQRGFRFGDRLVRPAVVRVGRQLAEGASNDR